LSERWATVIFRLGIVAFGLSALIVGSSHEVIWPM